jgi:hypothetical protein
MAVKNLTKAGVIMVAVLALVVIGCSSENPTAPAQSNLMSAGIDQSVSSGQGIQATDGNTMYTNNISVANPNDDREYDASFSGRVAAVDYKSRIIGLEGKANLQIIVEPDAPVLLMPERYVVDFITSTPSDSRSSGYVSPVVQGSDITVHGFFKGEELFVAQRIDVAQKATNDELIATSLTTSSPDNYSRDYEIQLPGRVSSVDYDARSFQIGEKEGLSFVLDKNAYIISMPDRTELDFLTNNSSSSSREQSGAISEGSRVVIYGTPKGDNLVVVGLLEVINNNLVSEVDMYSNGNF